MSKNIKSEHIISVIVFWCCVILVSIGFCIHTYWACLFFVFIVPIIFGTHEAIHENIIPNREKNKLKSIHNELALLVGGSFQIMNFKLNRQSHLIHHIYGRSDNGNFPEIILSKSRFLERLIYYANLTFMPAIVYQITGFILVFIPVKYLPFDFKIDLSKDRSPIPYLVIQLCSLICLLSFIYLGGLYKFLIFEVFFVLIWCLTQNSSHYGLKGIDSKTDRVCAYTFVLERPFKILTFGGTSHLAHHVEMTLPGLELYNEEVLKRIEEKIGVKIVVRYGLLPFIKSVIVQFKGPISIDKLHTNWIKSGSLVKQDKSISEI